MRPIKFRIWMNGRYSHKDEWIHIDQQGKVCMPQCCNEDCGPEDNQKNFIIEQFTGLHDKNGKEIYINDILQKSRHYQRMVSKEESEEIIENEILFVRESHELGFYICNKSGININNNTKNNFDHRFGGEPNYEEKIYLEVIGNIHQNPELLESK